MNNVLKYMKSIENEDVTNCLSIYFAYRNTGIENKYISYKPQVKSIVQRELIQTVFPYVINLIEKNKIVEYNPVGVADGEIEKIEANKIPNVNNFMESITDENVNVEMSSLKIDKISFYCIEIRYGGQIIYLFRQFQKLKKLRQGYLTRIVNNELQVMESDFLGIDEVTDMILFNNEILLLNHISLERIFNYRDEFLKKTNEALGMILSENVIRNIEQFSEDCRRDIRIMKRFTEIMTKERLPLFFENYDKVPEIVHELDLDIEFDEGDKLIYRDRDQLFHIINLLSDSYFKSLLANRTGVVKIEGEM